MHHFAIDINVQQNFHEPFFDDIRKSIDNGDMVRAVYIDLTNAFDTI